MKIYGFLALVGVSASLFIFAPELDLAFSRLFFNPEDGFFLGGWGPVEFFYEAIPLLVDVLLGLLALLVIIRLLPWLRRFHTRSAVIAYIALSLAIGPGLITNGILKDHWERARPAQTVEFGGTAQFSPAILPSDQCERNCSFVSGHAAMGFFMVTFAFLVAPGRMRQMAFAAAITFGALVGLGRIAQGAHFLSDVVFAGLINFAVAWVLYEWLIIRDGLSKAVLLRTRPLPLFGAIAGLTALSYMYFDRPAADLFRSLDQGTHDFFKSIAALGEGTGWLVASFCSFIVLWFGSRHRRLSEAVSGKLKAWSMLPLFFFSAVALSGIANYVVKVITGRARPKLYFQDGTYGFDWLRLHADYLSFPSGHANTAIAMVIALSLILPRYMAAFILVGGLIAFTRAIENAHFVSDVLFGGYIAMLVTAWLAGVFRRSGVELQVSEIGDWHPRKDRAWPERLGLPPAVAAALSRRRRHATPPAE